MKKISVLSVFYSCPTNIPKEKIGMSGGNRIFIESIKRWRGRVENSRVLTCPIGKAMLEKYVDEAADRGIEIRALSVPKILWSNLFLVFLYKTVAGSFAAVRASFFSNEALVVFSTSDIFPDCIPAFFAKLFNRKIKWAAAFYFFATSPFSRAFPYKGIVAMTRGTIYYYSQRACYFLIRHFADCVVACNEIDRRRFIADGFSADKICAIYGGVDLKAIESVPEPREKEYDAVFMARLHPQKGPLLAVQAWEKVILSKKDARLIIMGEGPEERVIRKYIRDHVLQGNVIFKGFVDGKEKYEVLKASKIFLHPAIYETGGMAAAEGMAAGLPVVAFDHGGFDYCYPNGMVRVSPVGDSDRFADKIVELLDNPGDYMRIKAEALQSAKTWDWDNKASFLLEKFSGLGGMNESVEKQWA